MLLIPILLTSLFISTRSDMVAVKKWAVNEAHTDMILSVNIYNDNSKFVSGSNDWTVKIWSMATYQHLHTENFTQMITHISLHPVDNRIFILCYNGNIRVLDPNTYAVLFNDLTYPTATGNGNYLQFFSSNSKFVVGGYDLANPKLHIFDSTTYAQVGASVTSTYTSGDEIAVTSASRDGSLLGTVSNAASGSIPIIIYNTASNAVFQSFQDNYAQLKWILFSPYSDQFYISGTDKTVKTYRLNSITSKYSIVSSFSTQDYGFPYCLIAKLQNKLIFSAGPNIVFLDITKSSPQTIFSRGDQSDIFVLDVSSDGRYLISGMRYGEITLWQIGNPVTKKDQDIMLLIILASSIGGFIVLIAVGIIIYRCCCVKKSALKDDSYEHNVENQHKRKNRQKKQNIRTQMSISGYDNRMDGSLELK